MAECSLPESQELCLEITVLALVHARIVESRDRRMFGNKNSFSCQSNLPFCVDKIQPKTYLGLSQASHGITAESGKVNPTKVLISMRLPRIQHVFRNPNSGTYNTQNSQQTCAETATFEAHDQETEKLARSLRVDKASIRSEM